MFMRTVCACLLATCLTTIGVTPAGAAEPGGPDPTAAIVAESSNFRYRQRDLDALVAIAHRHAGTTLNRHEEDQLRTAVLSALTVRESLREVLALLPSSLTPQARDQLTLDLLDFEGEAVPPASTRPPALTPQNPNAPDAVPADAAATPVTAAATEAPAATPAPASTSGDPILVRLPQLALPRTFPGIGKRTLVLGLAFNFSNEATATALQEQAPIIQDAILGYLHGLPVEAFTQPSQPALKQGIDAAIRSKIPTFPVDAVLIPELDVTGGEAKKPAGE